MPKLLITNGEKQGQVIRLSQIRTTIGRDPSNTVCLPDHRISRHHACIFPDAEQYIIEDLKSVNGVQINNTNVTRQVLKYGDEISLGSTRLIFLSLEASEKTRQGGYSDQVSLLSGKDDTRDFTVSVRLSPDKIKPFSTASVKPDSMPDAYERLKILYQISHEFSNLTDIDVLLQKICDLVISVAKADRTVILLKDTESGQLNVRAVSQKSGSQNEKIIISNTIAKEVLDKRESILISDTAQDKRFKEAQSILVQGIRSSICVPIKMKEQAIGIIYVDSVKKTAGFSQDDLQLIAAVAEQACVAIENAKLFEGLKQANQELKDNQAQLIEAEKLSVIGRLASGVAHEINNPLTSILGFAQLSFKQLTKDKLTAEELTQCAEHVKIIEDETVRCGQIVQSLLQFSRRKKTAATFIDVNQVIETTLNISRFHLKKGTVKIIKEFQQGLPQIPADANQLQQVFLNMIINARDAMESGGQLTISTALDKDQWIVVKFSDNGCGIPADKLEQIFKPLFTTKEEGKGTGLGLSISQDIIELHKGKIDVESIAGKGTTFIIRLPSKQNT